MIAILLDIAVVVLFLFISFLLVSGAYVASILVRKVFA